MLFRSVVATDAPGLRDSVRDGETGFLAATRSVADFAERIALLLEDDALATRMSRQAFAWSRKFDWDIAAAEMAEALQDATATKSVGRGGKGRGGKGRGGKATRDGA